MKTKVIIQNLILLFVLASCQHSYEMLTTIDTDGSCTRSYIKEADEAFILGDTSKKHNPFPFSIDTSWTVTWRNNTSPELYPWPADSLSTDTSGSSKPYVAFASKSFDHVDSLNTVPWFKHTAWDSLRTHVTFDKQFRWFYTYYTYSDKFPKLSTFDRVPLDNYLSNTEARVWLQDNAGYFKGMNGVEISEILEDIEKKFNQWINRNIFEEYYDGIVDNVEKINNPDITKDTLLVMKDEIYKSYPGKEDLFEDFNTEILDSIFTTDAFSTLLKNTPEIENRVEEKLAFIDYFEQTIDYKLVMPGTILESNARDIPGDTLYWKVDAYRFAVDDYALYAKSKHMNNGVIIISFIILLVFIMSFMNYMRNRFMP